jgi:hypothetical protein
MAAPLAVGMEGSERARTPRPPAWFAKLLVYLDSPGPAG